MKFRCRLENTGDGYRIHYQGSDLGEVEASATTREAALEKMKGELRYRLELCPCSGESYQHVEIELVT